MQPPKGTPNPLDDDEFVRRRAKETQQHEDELLSIAGAFHVLLGRFNTLDKVQVAQLLLMEINRDFQER